MHEQVDPTGGGELIVPINRRRVFARALYSIGLLVTLGGGFAFFLLRSDRDVHVAWVIVALAANLLWVVLLGRVAFKDLRFLKSRPLRVNSAGFEFGADRWAWDDLSAVERVVRFEGEDRIVRISVSYRPGRCAGTTSGVTPINPLDFDTGGRPLEAILQSWLTRYGTPAALADVPDASDGPPPVRTE